MWLETGPRATQSVSKLEVIEGFRFPGGWGGGRKAHSDPSNLTPPAADPCPKAEVSFWQAVTPAPPTQRCTNTPKGQARLSCFIRRSL